MATHTLMEMFEGEQRIDTFPMLTIGVSDCEPVEHTLPVVVIVLFGLENEVLFSTEEQSP